MAHIVARPNGAWDIREARATPAGPRSRTLVTFKTLTAEALERARARACKPLDVRELRRKAHRAGAPVEPARADRAAAELLGELTAGRKPRPMLRRMLADALAQSDPREADPRDNATAAAAWIGASPQRRGNALQELLMLVDQLPPARRADRSQRFPRIESKAA